MGIGFEPANVIILTLVSSFTLILNVPIIIILIARKTLGKPLRNIHILSLSITDALVGVNVIPISTILKSFIGGEQPNYETCWSRMCLFLTCFVASVFHVLFICVDRFTILHINLTSKRSKNIRLFSETVLSWICALLCIVIPFKKLKYERAIPYCSIATVFAWEDAEAVLKVWSFMFLNGILIVCIACILMVRKIALLDGHISSTESTRVGQQTDPYNIKVINVTPIGVHNAGPSSEPSQLTCSMKRHKSKTRNISKSQRNAIKTIIIMASSMTICLLPMNIMLFIEGWNGFQYFTTKQRHLIVYAATLNSAINPFIYAFRIHEVRETLRILKNKIQCCHIYCYFHEE